MENFLLDLSDYQIVKTLDKSDNQTVECTLIVQQKETKRNYFAKVYKTKYEDKQRFLTNLLSYIQTKHREIIEITGFSFVDFKGNFNTTILTPYMMNGSLREMIDKERNKMQPKNWTATKKQMCIIGIGIGLSYLHKIGITHRNLTPENILFDDNYYPKINNFGYCRIFEPIELHQTNKDDSTKLDKKELNNKEKYYFETEDIHSFGLILKEFYNLKYQNQNQNTENPRGDGPSFVVSSNSSIIPNQIIEDCMSLKSDGKPTMMNIIKGLIQYNDHCFEEVDKKEVDKYLSFYKGVFASEDNDFLEAIKYYKQAIELGNSDAMYNYAMMLNKGEGIEQNAEEAVKYLKQAIEHGNSDAMYNYAYMLRRGGEIKKNTEEAIKYYKQAIEYGNIDAVNDYACMLRRGEGIEKNAEEAVKYLKQAIEHGNSSAMNSYACMLKGGEGIEKNTEEAIKYYKQAIEHGNTGAMHNYACMLRRGEGIEQNTEEAVKYLKQAIEHGDSSAMHDYAYMLQKGRGIEKNAEEAVKYLKQAIELGNSYAIHNFAYMLQKGKGIEQNTEKAKSFLNLRSLLEDNKNSVYF